jgi:hypothetical protein
MFWQKKEEKMDLNVQGIWLRGFEQGFRLAWDYVLPYMQDSKKNLEEKLYQKAMEKALSDLEPTFKRLESLGHKIR